jgi:hypothetical protein
MSKLPNSLVNRSVALIAAIAIGVGGWFVANSIQSVDEGITQGGLGFSIPLVAAADLSSAGIGVLSTQAGLSAYMKSDPITDLDSLASKFDSLSFAGDTYIVGTTPIVIGGPYTGTGDIHVYADSNGYVVAFQPAHSYSPLDVVHWGADCNNTGSACDSPLSTTLLHKGLEFVAKQLDVSVPIRPNYYDWRYPSAEQVLIVADLVKNGQDEMQISIPSTATIHKSSIGWFGGIRGHLKWQWASGSSKLTTSSKISLNQTMLKSCTEHCWWTAADAKLAAGKSHTLSVEAGLPRYTNHSAVTGVAVMVVYSR